MNRFQLEVEEMDRRFTIRVRVATMVGVAAAVAAALWGAGSPNLEWIQTLYASWTNPQPLNVENDGEVRPESLSAAAPLPGASARQTNPISPPAFGNESSVSAAQQALFLVDVNPGRNVREGTARIGINPENPQTYVAGAILVNGARLAEVHSDRVVIERAGQRLTLHVSNDVGSLLSERSEGARDLGLVGAPAGEATPPPPNTVQLTDVIRAMPYFEADQLRGLQVYAGRQGGAFTQLGLKPGDIITAIDGVGVSDPVLSLQSLNALIEGTSMTVSVERGPESHVLSLDGLLISRVFESRSTADSMLVSMGQPPPQ